MLVTLKLFFAAAPLARAHATAGHHLPTVGAAILIVAGLICDVIILTRFVPAPEFRVTPKPWGLRELGYAIAILAGVFLTANILYGTLAYLRRQDIAGLAPLIIPIEFVFRLGMLAGFLLFFRERCIQLRQVIGPGTGTAIGWGIAFALAVLPPVGILIFTINALCRLLHIFPAEQPIVAFFLTTQSTPMLILLTIFAVVIAPIFEELFFRGFAYPVLKQRLGIPRALLLVSAVFALNHLHATSLLPLFLLAIGLGLAYELTGSLLAPITMHAVFNGIMVLQVFFQRGPQ